MKLTPVMCRKAFSILSDLIPLSSTATFINELHFKIHCTLLMSQFCLHTAHDLKQLFGIYVRFCLLESLQRSSFVLFISVSSLSVSTSLLLCSSEACPQLPTISIFLQTSNPLICGTDVLSVSLTCGHFFTAVNHTLKVLSTTAHRSLCVLQRIITESINKGINHWFQTCKGYAMAYKNISIFNSFLKVTQKQVITMEVKQKYAYNVVPDENYILRASTGFMVSCL